MEDILNNKYFLYLVAFISFTNVLGYLSMGNVESVLIFGATTALTGYFSKNWIVRLLAALVVTNVVFANYMIREGFQEGLSAPGKTSDVDREGDEEAKDEEGDENFEAATEEEEEEALGKGRVDYAATMEQAYDNLNNMLGKKVIDNLSNDTQNLVKKQQDLMNQIEKMKPILEGAQGVLEGLDMSKIEGMMDTFTGLMSKLR